MQASPITVETVVKAPLGKVWECWTAPDHIVHWYFASDDWEAPAAENDVRAGGRFKTVMAAKNKSAGFDLTGTYTAVKKDELLEFDLDDGRHVKVLFAELPGGVRVTETFEPENENSEEKQRGGWQSILDNFRTYVETSMNP